MLYYLFPSSLQLYSVLSLVQQGVRPLFYALKWWKVVCLCFLAIQLVDFYLCISYKKMGTLPKGIGPSFFYSGHQSCLDSHFILHHAKQYAQILTRRTSHSYFSWAFVSFQININTFTLKVYEHILQSGKKTNLWSTHHQLQMST